MPITIAQKDALLLDLDTISEMARRVRERFPDANRDAALRSATEMIDHQVALLVQKVLDRVE
jgi:hypothetical protein